jgi:hypothetical protein
MHLFRGSLCVACLAGLSACVTVPLDGPEPPDPVWGALEQHAASVSEAWQRLAGVTESVKGTHPTHRATHSPYADPLAQQIAPWVYSGPLEGYLEALAVRAPGWTYYRPEGPKPRLSPTVSVRFDQGGVLA